MKSFRDIPQRTRTPGYCVNMDWETLPFWLERQVGKGEHHPGGGLNIDPDFQRGHVWDKEQQVAYVEFVLSGGIGSNILTFNCKGWMGSFEGPFVLVDGKQRLAAVLAFLNNEITAFGVFLDGYDGRIPSYAEFVIKINDLDKKEDVLRWYLEMNSGGTPHTEEELEKVRKMVKSVKMVRTKK